MTIKNCEGAELNKRENYLINLSITYFKWNRLPSICSAELQKVSTARLPPLKWEVPG